MGFLPIYVAARLATCVINLYKFWLFLNEFICFVCYYDLQVVRELFKFCSKKVKNKHLVVMNVDHKSGFISRWESVQNACRNYFSGFSDKSKVAGRVASCFLFLIPPLVAALGWAISNRILAGRITAKPPSSMENVTEKTDAIGKEAIIGQATEPLKPDSLPHQTVVQGTVEKLESEGGKPRTEQTASAAPVEVAQPTKVVKAETRGWPDDLPDFSQVKSNKLVTLNVVGVVPNVAPNREQFLNDPNYQTDPPVLSTSPWVPKELIEHLMKDKRKEAYDTKWLGGQQPYSSTKSRPDCITNMEGAMHTFVTPLIKVKLSSDFVYAAAESVVQSLGGKGRPIIMSAAIQPDMESTKPGNEVIFRICQLEDEVVHGIPLKDNFEVLSPADKQNVKKRGEYDEALRKHMIYHLTSDHALPSQKQKDVEIVNLDTGVKKIEALIGNQNATSKDLEKMAIQIGDRVLSLEVLYNLYKNQLENELLALEKLCPQGYVYSIDPPHIFLAAIGGSSNGQFLNRLQALAIKELAAKGLLKNMKKVCFAHFSDREGVKHYQKALGAGIEVLKKHALPGDNIGPFAFQKDRNNFFLKRESSLKYLIKEPWAFVIHNNSDAFGQNIQYEEPTSADGYVGSFSDASVSLLREREDLCSHIVDPRAPFP
jgi:hypothetical protein